MAATGRTEAQRKALAELRRTLTRQQWLWLLKAGLCVACKLALSEQALSSRDEDEDDPQEDD